MKSNVKHYIIVFAWLAIITLLELGAVMVQMPHHALVLFILGTALAKAVLIALFFMHLKSERKIVWWIPGVPILLALFFVLMLFPDMVYHLTLHLGG